MSAAAPTAAIERIMEQVARGADPSRRAEQLILGLADAVKETSNDQNVQRLARELRASAAGLAASIA